MSQSLLPHEHGQQIEHDFDHMPAVDDFRTVSMLFKQLGDPVRIRIFWLLCHCEECVINIAALVDMSSPAVAHHLRLLRESGLVESRKDGKEVYYRAVQTPAAEMLHHMIERMVDIACLRPDDEEGNAAAAGTEAESRTGAEYGTEDGTEDEAGIEVGDGTRGGEGAAAKTGSQSGVHFGEGSGSDSKSTATTATAAPGTMPMPMPMPETCDSCEPHDHRVTAQQLATVREIHAYLTEDLARRVTIEELSRKFLMNSSTLKAAFKAVYGLPVATYMQEYRMHRAVELLQTTQDSIATVAQRVGYENQGKFSKVFREYVGVSPTECRRMEGACPV